MNIVPVFNPNGNILQFLEEGVARVYVYNQFADYFRTLADRKSAKIEETMKKREEIATLAMAKSLASKKAAESE